MECDRRCLAPLCGECLAKAPHEQRILRELEEKGYE